MTPKVTVIDYGVGNLLSVTRAFEHCGAEVLLTDQPSLILKSERLVLPGVGAFSDGMAGLQNRGLIEPIKDYAKNSRPFLGICLGMQMMFDASEEFGVHPGLSLISGKVLAIPKTGVDGKPHKIPHISWNELLVPAHQPQWKDTILNGISPGEAVYFIHSYTPIPSVEESRLADALYDGRRISAVVRSGKLYGCQFHPEKSGKIGLQVIRNFLSLS